MTTATTLTDEDFQWKLAKISKHGYTDFDNENDCTKAIIFLRSYGVTLKGGKEYYREAETNDFIIEPTKSNAKRIANIVKQEFGIDPY